MLLVIVDRTTPVAVFVAETLTSGITAPLLSVTCPTICPVLVCATQWHTETNTRRRIETRQQTILLSPDFLLSSKRDLSTSREYVICVTPFLVPGTHL